MASDFIPDYLALFTLFLKLSGDKGLKIFFQSYF